MLTDTERNGAAPAGPPMLSFTDFMQHCAGWPVTAVAAAPDGRVKVSWADAGTARGLTACYCYDGAVNAAPQWPVLLIVAAGGGRRWYGHRGGGRYTPMPDWEVYPADGWAFDEADDGAADLDAAAAPDGA